MLSYAQLCSAMLNHAHMCSAILGNTWSAQIVCLRQSGLGLGGDDTWLLTGLYHGEPSLETSGNHWEEAVEWGGWKFCQLNETIGDPRRYSEILRGHGDHTKFCNALLKTSREPFDHLLGISGDSWPISSHNQTLQTQLLWLDIVRLWTAAQVIFAHYLPSRLWWLTCPLSCPPESCPQGWPSL